MVDDTELHARRASSFGARACAYAQHRPDYPQAAVEWALGERSAPGLSVLDLGAGTGKLSATLNSLGYDVLAVEPDDAMRAELTAYLPRVTTLNGSAEDIPVPDASVDAVLVGQAFHWFDADRALPEIARVLRSGGVLAALWNYHDDEVEWVAGLRKVSGGDWGAWEQHERGRTIPAHPAFTEPANATFKHSHRRTAQSLVDTIGTHSRMLVRPEQDRAEALSRIEEYLRTCPHTANGEFSVPLRTLIARMIRR
jgi:SAM-dependent methyltransferase